MFVGNYSVVKMSKKKPKRDKFSDEDTYYDNLEYQDLVEYGSRKAKETKQKQKARRDKRENMWEGWNGL